MFVGDSRRMGGPGILPLRHQFFEKDGYDLAMRASVLGVRVQKWRMEFGQVSAYFYNGPDDIGDLNHALFWPIVSGPPTLTQPTGSPGTSVVGPPAPRGREIPSISWAYPAILTKTGEYSSSNRALPAKAGWRKDERFAELSVALPPSLSSGLPVGTEGIVVAATNEETEHPLFFASASGPAVDLIAVHHAGDPSMGSPVFDLTAANQLAADRMARLQSLTRVVKQPVAVSIEDPGKSVNLVNELAWNIGKTGRGDTHGGIVTDQNSTPIVPVGPVITGTPGSPVPPPAPGGTAPPTSPGEVWGETSTRHGGPFAVGQPGDQHKLGEDADGNEINPVHIPTNALFWEDRLRDAPLHFEQHFQGSEKLYPTTVHLGLDPLAKHTDGVGRSDRKGLWKWWTTSMDYIPGDPPGVPGGPPGETIIRENVVVDFGLDRLGIIPIGPNIPMNPPVDGDKETPPDQLEQILQTPEKLNYGPVASGRDPSPRCAPQREPRTKREIEMSRLERPIDTSPAIVGLKVADMDNIPQTGLPTVGNPPGPLAPTPNESVENLNVLPPNLQRSRSEEDIKIDPSAFKRDRGLPPGGGLPEVANTFMTMTPPQKFTTIQPWQQGTPEKTFGATTIETAGPVQLARPAQPVRGKPDLRNETQPDERQVSYIDRTTPITGRMEAFGAKVGAEFVYTHRPGTARYKGGTGPGGWVITPPELGIEDADTDMIREEFPVSETRVIFAPGTSCCFGPPDLESGGIKDGFELSYEGGPLTVNPVDPFSRLTFTNTWLPAAAGALTAYWPVNFNGVDYYIPLHV